MTDMAQEVFLVIVIAEDGNDHYGIFSSEEKASAWADTQDDPCLITPYIIDMPEYGDAQTQ